MRGEAIYARLRFVDDTGKVKSREWKCKNRTAAKDLLKIKLRELDDAGPKSIILDRVTFADLAAQYEKGKLIPAEYHVTSTKTVKVAGLRSLQGPLIWIKTLSAYFGAKRLRSLTYSSIEEYKLTRLRTETVGKTQRSISSVNREMSLLRSMLRFAVREGMISKSPFDAGGPLISLSNENRRERVLSYDEEKRLLAACEGVRSKTYERKGKEITAEIKSKRGILKAIIILALDTGLRRGEILTLTWANVDLISRQLNILAFNTKTAKARSVGMTPRVFYELDALYSKSRKDPNDLVFGISDNFKRSFAGAREDAEIDGLTFHDLRHTAITRMVQAGLPAPVIMKISGHTQMSTFQRYVNPDGTAVQDVAATLDHYNDISGRNHGAATTSGGYVH